MGKKVVLIVITVAIILSSGLTVLADQGTTAAAFLKLEEGARPIAMGGAFTALADDVNATLWNPAGLALLPSFEATFMHSIWLQSIFYDYLAGAYPFGDIGTLGLAIVYVNSGDIPGWDINGNPQAAFSAGDLGIDLGYGTQINKQLSLGISIKLFNETIANQGSFGFVADIGGIYKIQEVPGLQFGACLQNLGPKFGFGESFLPPVTVKLGAAYKGFYNMVLTLDYIQPIETNGILAAGFEYWYRDLLVVRTGYQYQGMFDMNHVTEGVATPQIMAGFVIGAGIKFDIYELDYAFQDYGVLGSTHRIGLTLKFK